MELQSPAETESPRETALSGTQSLDTFLANWRELASVGTEDVLAAILPLMSQLNALHKEGQVGPLAQMETINADNGHLWFSNADAKPIQSHPRRVRTCLLYTSPSPRDQRGSRMPSSA